MNDLCKSIETLYTNRKKFVVIGLTGRTGCGCSTTARMLSSSIEKIKLPKPSRENDNEERKYRICYDFANKNWEEFVWIQLKDIITSFILDNDYASFKNYAATILSKGIITKSQIEKILDENIQEEYEILHKQRLDIKALRDKTENEDTIHKKDVEERREQAELFYFTTLPPFTEKLKKHLSAISGETYTTFYQKAGDNIRSSGNALDETYDSNNIHRLAIRVNKVIKIFRNKNRKNNKVYVVIDAIRNPFEAVFFRERYSAFYLLSINTPEEDRVYRLKKTLNLTDSQLNDIDKKEGEKKLRGPDFFYSQNIPACIQSADIHINNPQEGTSDYNTLKKQLIRYVSLILQPGIVTPSREERCMQLAHTAKLNSGCISRQVGAVVTDSKCNIMGVGWNSSPEGQSPCILRNCEDLLNQEDKKAYSNFENNDIQFRNKLEELYSNVFENTETQDKLLGRNVTFCFKDIYNKTKGKDNQVHTRALHAEENAFLQITKNGGQGVKGGKLFTTASPCELCSKKAYQLGIKEIFYIDPYPGIAFDHILNFGDNKPSLLLFTGSIGRAYNQLYEPIISYKDELKTILNI